MRWIRSISVAVLVNVAPVALVTAATLASVATAGCKKRDPLYCDEQTACLAGHTACSLTGACVPDNVAKTCIPDEQICWDAGAVGDAAAIDAPSFDAQPSEGPSCSGLTPTCGAVGNDSCCSSSVVPGGTFYRSYDEAAGGWDDMGFPATVSDFRLDTYEITVGRFRKFVQAGQGTQAQPPVGGSGAHPVIAGSGWDANWNRNLEASTTALIAAVQCSGTYETWTDTPGANEHRPMNCLTWYEAMAFCIWDGGYLPTEAEWNYAAAGGAEQRAYPWSSPPDSATIDPTYAVYDDGGLLAIGSVGSKSPKGDGRWGHADLAGNVQEWTLDWWADYSLPCNDCATLMAGSPAYRIHRGASYFHGPAILRVANRLNADPTSRVSFMGARCARSL